VAKKASSKKTKSSAVKKAAGGGVPKTARKAAKVATSKAPAKTAKTAVRQKVAAKKGKIKSPLSKAELKEFRKTLLDKRRDLVGDLSGIEAGALRRSRQDGTGDLSNLPTHPADIGTDNYEQEFSLGLLESERVLLEEIDQALERIANGTYGVCLGTGRPIGKPRLKARPWAKYCIEYARMIEKGLVRPDEDREAEIAGYSEEDEEPEEEAAPEETEEPEADEDMEE